MKKLLLFFSVLFQPFFAHTQQVQQNPPKVLMVVSSYGKDNGKTRPGFELDEFSQAYWIFKDNGLQVEVASPKGGKVEPDKFNREIAYNQRLINDAEAMRLLETTHATASVKGKTFDAVYIVGGKGAMFDLPVDPSMQDILMDTYSKDGVIATVCHGTAALVHLKNGSEYLVKGRNVTGFCNSEEEKFGKNWVKEFPFLLETKLIERGALYQKGEDMLPFALVDGKLISGQNPYSTTEVAESIVISLGLSPVKRELYKDERSMLLVKKALHGEYSWAKESLAYQVDAYNVELIAVYGYYALLYSKDQGDEVQKALSIIELTQPYFFQEQLWLEAAKGYRKLGKTDKAKEMLHELVEKDLLVAEAQALLKEWK